MCPTAAFPKLGYSSWKSAQRRTGQIFGFREILEQFTTLLPHMSATEGAWNNDQVLLPRWFCTVCTMIWEREAFTMFPKTHTLFLVSCNEHLSEAKQSPQRMKNHGPWAWFQIELHGPAAGIALSLLEALNLVQVCNLTFHPRAGPPDVFLNPPDVNNLPPRLQTSGDIGMFHLFLPLKKVKWCLILSY